jgi:mevalonate kinase
MDGAKAIALPCKKGQSLQVKPLRGSDLVWESFDKNGDLWFETQISLYDFKPIRTSDEDVSFFLHKLLRGAVRLNSEFLNNWNGFRINTFLEFPRDWGLGSSSSIIYAVSEWADVNPFLLYYEIANGSAFDVACAFLDGPITYTKSDDEISYAELELNFPFEKCLFLVHRGKKQNTEAAINYYRKAVKQSDKLVQSISDISDEIIQCTDKSDFEKLIREHEAIISDAIGVPSVQKEKFSDFNGTIKSLGAWGGDFMLVVANEPEDRVKEYFKSKGLNTVMPYSSLVL